MPDTAAALPYLLLDVFTDVPLEGNPLAVFTDAAGLPAELMQRLARELNLSESVFVGPARAGADASLRIFTPTVELPFAGHPVLGAAIALAGGRERIELETGSGVVPVLLGGDAGRAAFARMHQPLPSWRPYGDGDALLAALGVERSGLPLEAYRNGPEHVLVELPGAQAVGALRPDMGALAELGQLCVSCFAPAGRSWRSRMFAPSLGVAEDPATGSAAGPLAVHLGRHGRVPFGEQVEILQGVELGRPSRLYARAFGSAARLERVEVGGSAVVVARGEFRLPSAPGG